MAPAGYLVASLTITDKERFMAEYASKVAATGCHTDAPDRASSPRAPRFKH